MRWWRFCTATPALARAARKTKAHAAQRLLDDPVLPPLARLAAPNALAIAMTVLGSVAETDYVRPLGTMPLAAMALGFPFAMLTQMLTARAMGAASSTVNGRA